MAMIISGAFPEKSGNKGMRRTVIPVEESAFVGGYALVDGCYFVDEAGNAYRQRSANSDEKVLEMIPGGFAMVQTRTGEVAYRDYVTDILWETKPESFVRLDFMSFFVYGGLFYLRMPMCSHSVAFKAEDMWIRGNAMQRPNALCAGEVVFLHRAMPRHVFRFLGYNTDMTKRLLPINDEVYYYSYRRGGRKPIRTNEKILPIDSGVKREE